jgi:hypothetical protein
MKPKKYQMIGMAAYLALAGVAKAQFFTGSINAMEGSPLMGSFTSSSLTLDPTNIIIGTSGTFSSSVPFESDLTAYNDTITGLSSSPLSESISDYFVFSSPDPLQSSGTTPNDRFEFNLTSITEDVDGTFSGTGTLVDTQGLYAPTEAAFNLSFSSSDNYSLTLEAVPEPTTVSLLAVAMLSALTLLCCFSWNWKRGWFELYNRAATKGPIWQNNNDGISPARRRSKSYGNIFWMGCPSRRCARSIKSSPQCSTTGRKSFSRMERQPLNASRPAPGLV